LTFEEPAVILTNIVGDITNIIGTTAKKVGDVMLEPIVGSKSSEQVFIFLIAREMGYATEMAKFFDADLYAIQRQLERLEKSEVLVSRKVGRTRVYQFNPRYPFLIELKSLLERVLSYYPEAIQEKLLLNRRRPRKKDKPL
jgi:hypothetical protein